MSHRRELIESLRAALRGAPGDIALAAHLAALMLDEGEASEALGLASGVLATKPDHLEALRVCAAAAEMLGDAERSAAYRRLWSSLSGTEGRAPDEPRPEPQHAPATAGPVRLRVVRGGADDADAMAEAEDPRVTLADVAGMREVKRRLEIAFLGPLRNPELRKLYGKSLRGGLLLYGPPGCGKTFLARAVAGELGARFLSVGLSDVLDMYLGESERKLHELFELARRSSPSVLFFDEIDALGRRRSLVRESAGRTLINQLLAELDGLETENRGLFVLAATNHPWDVDSALRRPGRLDRTVLVLPPDPDARRHILQANLERRPLGADLDLDTVVRRTDGFSGADLVHLCESAAEQALADSIESGTPRPISAADLRKALSEIRPSVRPWLETARNYALFANEGGVYDDLVVYLRQTKLL